MTVAEAAGELKQFRRTPWNFQQTFLTPLENLQRFVATILSAAPLMQGGVTIETVVFEPKHLLALLASHAIPSRNLNRVTLTAGAPSEIAPLLEAALGDWVDFLFIPVPKPFAIYADHDEYTTLYANSRSNLNRVATRLRDAGFQAVAGYQRRL